VQVIILLMTVTAQVSAPIDGITTSGSSSLIINEFMVLPEASSSELKGQYVEIFNRSNEWVNLAGWSLENHQGDIYYFGSYMLPPLRPTSLSAPAPSAARTAVTRQTRYGIHSCFHGMARSPSIPQTATSLTVSTGTQRGPSAAGLPASGSIRAGNRVFPRAGGRASTRSDRETTARRASRTASIPIPSPEQLGLHKGIHRIAPPLFTDHSPFSHRTFLPKGSCRDRTGSPFRVSRSCRALHRPRAGTARRGWKHSR